MNLKLGPCYPKPWQQLRGRMTTHLLNTAVNLKRHLGFCDHMIMSPEMNSRGANSFYLFHASYDHWVPTSVSGDAVLLMQKSAPSLPA
jgi:hypothetical protein